MRRFQRDSWSQWRKRHVRWALIPSGLAMITLSLGTLISAHYDNVYRESQEPLVAQNEFWLMLAQGESNDTTLGELAREIQPLLEAENPTKALLENYVEPGSYPENVSELLGMPVFTATLGRTDSLRDRPDHGYFSPDLTVLALQATPENVQDILVEADTDAREASKVFTWPNAPIGGALPWLLLLLVTTIRSCYLVPQERLERRRELAEQKKQKAAEETRLQQMPEEAQEIDRLIQKIDSSFDPLDKKARALRNRMQKALDEALKAPRLAAVDKNTALGRLEAEFGYIVEGATIRAEVYESMQDNNTSSHLRS